MSDFNFKKKYGQNFLVDENILSKIAGTIVPNANDLILEIGPGSGNLTKYLKKYNCQVLAYEIDIETKKYLDRLVDDKTTIIYEDFLTSDIKKHLNGYEYDKLYIVANLPYYITTPIIEKIINTRINPQKMILMVQKEVADRLSAIPGTRDYGYITAYLNYYFQIKKLFDVSKNSFNPRPKVESAVIEFENFKRYSSNNEEQLQKIIKSAFLHKRKNMNNNFNGYDKEIIKSILKKNNLSLQSRAEEVSIEVFVDISNAL